MNSNEPSPQDLSAAAGMLDPSINFSSWNAETQVLLPMLFVLIVIMVAFAKRKGLKTSPISIFVVGGLLLLHVFRFESNCLLDISHWESYQKSINSIISNGPDCHASAVYAPASAEQYIMDHADSLGYNSEKDPSACRIWTSRKESDIFDSLQSYRQDLANYTSSIQNFPVDNIATTTKPLNLRDHIRESQSWDICRSVNVNVESLFRNSGQVSRIPGSGELVEPLFPPLRHPDLCFRKRAQNPFSPKVLRNVLRMDYLVHDFGNMCRQLKPHSRVVFMDMGASLIFHGNETTSPAIDLMRLYQKFGFHFDHIHAYEQVKTDPTVVYERIPRDLMSAYHWINVGVNDNIGHKLNPWTLLKEEYGPDDLVIVKLDIDTPVLENSLVQQILDDPELSNRIDHFYFEHHVHMRELAPYWLETVSGSLKDSLGLFTQLRVKGIAAHSWV